VRARPLICLALLVCLSCALAPPAAEAAGGLRAGDRGPKVVELQRALRRAGIRLTADGSFGPATKRAVKRFQRRAGLNPTGAAGPKTLAALGLRPARATTTTPPEAGPAAEPAPAPTAGGPALPPDAPPAVRALVDAANRIATKPYVYGGGHRRWDDTGYDCSGSVSYALYGAALLDAPLPSGDFMDWGDAGPGRWVTIYANPDHMFMIVAGMRFDTSGLRQAGTRWQTSERSLDGFVVRHPPGL
jgi:cell wall-associated NlpC family hydrolase